MEQNPTFHCFTENASCIAEEKGGTKSEAIKYIIFTISTYCKNEVSFEIGYVSSYVRIII